ncbi:Intramembrane protease 2 [Phlyctema vagabunda]|uniref:Intramembrane protease 2 n=1 Tax=Phlyctema vagabunda TaxID=108571 RepID=A0ABR4PTB4_9HELO
MDAFFENLQGESPVLQLIGRWGYKLYEGKDTLQMSLHLLLAALFPIYIGSHASLRRPPSARVPEKGLSQREDEDEDDELDAEATVEGLTPSDAIMFPILAGCTLGVLYFIIKWLEDPALLNKLLGYYFSVLGVFGIGKLIGDGLNVGTTFIFPNVWSSGNQAYHVDPLFSQQVTGDVKPSRVQVHRKFVDDKMNPLPGYLSTLKFSEKNTKRLWAVRALFKDHWIFRGYCHGIFSAKSKVQLNDAIGLVIGLAAIVLYNLTGKAWFLTNLMGFGFCYGTLQLLSPTTFWTGTLVLAGLFVYDIVMVFYTPMMVTVATKLDVPIKLVIPGKQGGMLGLGDIVLPGIMIALALRYDLYLHYLRKRTSTTPISLKPTSVSSFEPKIIKATYIPATGDWGERFWTSSAVADGSKLGGRFPKVYFYASIIGYIVGMSVTMIVLRIYNHAQPALLYLVPGVLIALWGTATARGEVGMMWRYTEDGSLDDNDQEDKKKEEAQNGGEKEKEKESKTESKESLAKTDEHSHHVFLFSLSAPKPTSEPKKALLFGK